jgi:cytochrome c-type biogenesis protein CcmE
VRSGARFFIAVALAVVLGGWLAYTSLGGTLQEFAGPGELSAAGGTYRLNGLVANGAPGDAAARAQSASGLRFQVQDKKQPGESVTVVYRGSVPDTFRSGREVVLTGKISNGVFVAERNSLITLCPSKFMEKPSPGSNASAEGGAGSPASG